MRTLASLAILSVLSHRVSGDTCQTYMTGYCSKFVNYDAFISTGSSMSSIEAAMKAGGMDLLIMLNNTQAADRPCVNAYLEYTCYMSYPSCSSGAIKDVVCKSVCEAAVSQCTGLFTQFGKVSSLPDCSKPIPGFNLPFGASSTCLGYSASTPAPPTTPLSVSCPSFLLPNPAFNLSNPNQVLPSIPGQNCVGSCCVPCPSLDQFYPTDQINSMNKGFQAVVFCSTFGSLFVVLSYLAFPEKRVHPGKMAFFFSLSCLFTHAVQIWNIGSDSYRTTCSDRITEAQGTDPLCAVQGTLLVFFSFLFTFWIAAFMINLHLSLVWRQDWFSERYTHLHIGALLYSLIPTAMIVADKGIGAGSSVCFVDSNHALNYMLIPLGVVGWLGVGITSFTVVYLIRVLTLGPGNMSTDKKTEKTAGKSQNQWVSKSTSLLDRANASQMGDEEKNPVKDVNPTKTETNDSAFEKLKRKLKRQKEKFFDVVSKSWRSIMLAVSISFVFATFFIENVLYLIVMRSVDSSTQWLSDWYTCALQGNSREQCSTIALQNIPNFTQLVLSQFNTFLGVIIFIVFGPGFLKDWKEFIFKK